MSRIFSRVWQTRTNERFLRRSFEALSLQIGAAALSARDATNTKKKHLWDWELKVFSQWGEDGIIDFIVKRLEISQLRIFEIGSGNFSECNSRFAAEYLNASVVAVDSREDLISNVESMDVFWKGQIFPRQLYVTPENVEEIFDEATRLMAGIDIISLDIDGNDYWVLEKLDLSGVRCVIVEINPVFGGKHPISIPRDDLFDRTKAHHSWLYFGMSFQAAKKLMKDKGFELIGSNRVGNNLFFVQNSEAKFFEDCITTADDYREAKYWRVRESRDQAGNLSYLSPKACLEIIGDCKVENVVTGEINTLNRFEVD